MIYSIFNRDVDLWTYITGFNQIYCSVLILKMNQDWLKLENKIKRRVTEQSIQHLKIVHSLKITAMIICLYDLWRVAFCNDFLSTTWLDHVITWSNSYRFCKQVYWELFDCFDDTIHTCREKEKKNVTAYQIFIIY